jgi:hypothetical protein
MPKYRVPVMVRYTEYYEVEASDPEEAAMKFKEGEAIDCVEQEFYEVEDVMVDEVEEIVD